MGKLGASHLIVGVDDSRWMMGTCWNGVIGEEGCFPGLVGVFVEIGEG